MVARSFKRLIDERRSETDDVIALRDTFRAFMNENSYGQSYGAHKTAYHRPAREIIIVERGTGMLGGSFGIQMVMPKRFQPIMEDLIRRCHLNEADIHFNMTASQNAMLSDMKQGHSLEEAKSFEKTRHRYEDGDAPGDFERDAWYLHAPDGFVAYTFKDYGSTANQNLLNKFANLLDAKIKTSSHSVA